jgi:hypothetical protein
VVHDRPAAAERLSHDVLPLVGERVIRDAAELRRVSARKSRTVRQTPLEPCRREFGHPFRLDRLATC